MDETFNIKEVALYLKCSISGVRNLVRDKKIPFYRIGNRLFFKKSSIDLWINTQEINNTRAYSYEPMIKPLRSEVS